MQGLPIWHLRADQGLDILLHLSTGILPTPRRADHVRSVPCQLRHLRVSPRMPLSKGIRTHPETNLCLFTLHRWLLQVEREQHKLPPVPGKHHQSEKRVFIVHPVPDQRGFRQQTVCVQRWLPVCVWVVPGMPSRNRQVLGCQRCVHKLPPWHVST
jgi:hypothetical protein